MRSFTPDIRLLKLLTLLTQTARADHREFFRIHSACPRRVHGHTGSAIVAGKEYGRVRSIKDSTGALVESAGPSEPVEVSGLKDVPSVGDVILVVATEDRARRLVEARSKRVGLKSTGARVTICYMHLHMLQHVSYEAWIALHACMARLSSRH